MADQAAGKGSGQGAGQRFVQFSRGAAQRIAKAVREVEQGNRSQPGLANGPRLQGGPGGKVFRMATFTGSWNIDAQKAVTFRNQTNTANAITLFTSIGTAAGSRTCAIAKDGTAWYLIAAACD